MSQGLSIRREVEPATDRAARAVPIDHAFLSRYTFGNRELECEVLELYADQAPDYLENLRCAETEKAWRDAAHTIKGSARAVGAHEVAERAELAETLARSCDEEARRNAIARLETALGEVRRYISTLSVPA
jgi:HPt (histidine-containing phosphotransfer) domain-containing protein